MHEQSQPAGAPRPQSTDRLSLALQMARHGLGIFPLRPGTKGPYRAEGVSAATCDAEQIIAWFAERPGMNYGCCTTDFVVLDVDVKHGAPGLRSLETIGALPDTLQVATPTGGLHIYLGAYHSGQADIAAGINVRAHNGYVVGPGCALDGLPELYRIVNDAPVAPTPAHIARQLKPIGHGKELATSAGIELDTDEAVARACAYLERRAGMLQGGRNNAGYAVACGLRDYGLSQDKARELLETRWNARNVPPLSQFELAEVVRNAWHYGQNAEGVRAPEAEFEALPEDALPKDEAQGGTDVEETPRQWFRPLQIVRDPATHPRRPWLVPGMLLRGHLTGLISPGGIGKSSLALGLALGCAAGDVAALGLQMSAAVSRCPVVIISTEDDEAEIWARTWGYCQRHGLDMSVLEGNVHIFDGGDTPFKSVARHPASKQLHRTKMLASLSQYVAAVGAGLVVFDPLVETHDAQENDNGEVALVMSAMRAVCRGNGAAGLVVHHSRKLGPLDAISPDNAARGAGALVNGFRLNFMLSRPTAEDAAGMGLSEADAAPLFRLDKGKGNYLPPGRDTKWFRTVGLQMPNGDAATGEPGTITHAVEMYDPEPARARVREALHCLVAELLAGTGGQIVLAEAVNAVMRDPVLGGEEKAVRERLEGLFGGQGHSYDGCTIRLCVENPQAVRPRKVLRAD